MNVILWHNCGTEDYLGNLRRRGAGMKGSSHPLSEYLTIFEPKIDQL